MYEALFRNQEDIFKVIANQKRLEIIQLLTHGELSVSQMVAMLGISQSNVSQHLALLRQANVLQARKEGTTVYYQLSNPKIAEACSLIRQFLIERDGGDGANLFDVKHNDLYPLVHDVVCGMRMSVSESPAQKKYLGEEYFFCGDGCKQMFERQPKKYIKSTKAT